MKAFKLSLTAFFTLILTISGGPLWAAPVALLYNGPAADPDGVESMTAILTGIGVEVRTCSDLTKLPSQLKGVSLFSIGGTTDDLAPINQMCTPKVAKAVSTWLEAGGTYLGICGGAIMACDSWDDDTGHHATLELFPTQSESFVEDQSAKILPIRWSGKSVPMFFQYGPTFLKGAGFPRGTETFATYSNGKVAGLTYIHGKGKVALLGPHPEATKDWLSEDLPGAETWVDSRPLLTQLIQSLGF
jgi:glutamine amidotransferase-like uncharacterized protein